MLQMFDESTTWMDTLLSKSLFYLRVLLSYATVNLIFPIYRTSAA